MEQPYIRYCSDMSVVVPPIYYVSSLKFQHYFQIVPIYHLEQPVQKCHQIKMLMFSKFADVYHIELLLTINYGNPYWWDLTVTNCYTSLSGSETGSFVGIYVNQSAYAYFLLQSTLL
jgi:hypothetical protein